MKYRCHVTGSVRLSRKALFEVKMDLVEALFTTDLMTRHLVPTITSPVPYQLTVNF